MNSTEISNFSQAEPLFIHSLACLHPPTEAKTKYFLTLLVLKFILFFLYRNQSGVFKQIVVYENKNF